MERAIKYAASKGISLDTLIARTLATLDNHSHTTEQKSSDTSQTETTAFGRLRGTVLYMAEDFNAPLDDFKEYME